MEKLLNYKICSPKKDKNYNKILFLQDFYWETNKTTIPNIPQLTWDHICFTCPFHTINMNRFTIFLLSLKIHLTHKKPEQTFSIAFHIYLVYKRLTKQISVVSKKRIVNLMKRRPHLRYTCVLFTYSFIHKIQHRNYIFFRSLCMNTNELNFHSFCIRAVWKTRIS